MASSNLATIGMAAGLPGLIDRAAGALANARTSAEILEARDMASVAYDMAKKAARLATAKGAHDTLIAAAHRAQADALEIEAGAKRRLADEYDAAQERGEIARNGGDRKISLPVAKTEDAGLTHREIHEARLIRNAEASSPGIVRRTLDEAIEAGEEPTKAAVRRAVLRTVKPDAVPARPSRGRDAIRARVTDAITALSGLPPAHEVVGFFCGSDAASIVDERIRAAAQWLSDFNTAWGDREC